MSRVAKEAAPQDGDASGQTRDRAKTATTKATIAKMMGEPRASARAAAAQVAEEDGSAAATESQPAVAEASAAASPSRQRGAAAAAASPGKSQ